jgi:hypothetical protein
MDLKNLIAKRLEAASSHEIIEIVSTLCEVDEPVQFSFIKPEPAVRFTKRDGVIEDATTGLMWTAEDVGRATWAEAKKLAAAATVGGFKDWRLPTIRELQSLVDFDRHSPAIDPVFSNCKADWYWTSTPYASSPGDFAWFVFFSYGDSSCHYQYDKGLVRAVRPRQ